MKSCYIDKPSRSIADLCDYYGLGMILTRINVPLASRGLGHGRRLLARILSDADAEDVTLWLEISPSDGLDYDQLSAWYARHGFEDRGGVWKRAPAANPSKHKT